MVYVSEQPMQQPVNVSSGVNGILDIFINNWAFLLVLIIALVAGFLAYYFWKRANEERKERDSDLYTLYNNILRSCETNADKSFIKKRYSLLNLLWFGIPFKMIEQSKKYIDIENKLIGYYRGHYIGQDGFINILLYKTKSFIFFENLFVLRYPLKLIIEDTDKKGKTIKSIIEIHKKFSIEQQFNKDVKINCYGIEKIGLYYYMPVFVMNLENMEVADLRSYVEDRLRDSSFQITNSRLISLFSSKSREMIEMNPNVQHSNATASMKQRSEEIRSEELDTATGK